MSPDPWDIGNNEREEIYKKQRTHGPNADGGVESVGISMEDFDSWPHTKIKKASDGFQPDLANQVSEGWDQLASGFKDALANFTSSLDTAINGSWTGVGAEAAKNTIADYKAHSEQVSDGMALMATKPAEAATAISQVKALMPEPVEVTAPTSNSSPDDLKRYQAQESLRQQKENEARMIMRTVYAPVFQQAANGVPVLPDAPQFAGGAPSTSTAPQSSEYGTGKPIEPGKVVSGDDARVSSAAFAQDPTGGGGLGGAAGAALGAAGGGGAGGAALGGAAGAGTGLAGSAGMGAGAGAGTAVGASNSNASQGSSVPGTYGIGRWARPSNKDDEKDKDKDDKAAQSALLGPMIAGSVGATAAMPATTVSPMQGMGIAPPPTMVPAGAAHHQQDNEEEHFTPEFLVSLDNGNELIGPLPKVSPAVIGVWTEEHLEYQNPPPSPYDPRPRDSEE